jgi:hypothetical protein
MTIVSRPTIDFHENYEDYEDHEDYDYDDDYEDDYDDEQVPRPPIFQLRRPPASASAKIPSTLRWRPIPWTGIPLLEDIQEIKSQESLEIRS